MRIELPQPPRRILLIKPSALGDVVHTLPVLNLLRRRWPEAHISWLIGSAFAGLIEGHPQLNEVILFDRKGMARGWNSPLAMWRFARDLASREFDLVIDLQGLLRSGIFSRLCGAPARVGFANARELAHLFYTHRVPVETMEQHAIERYLSVAEALGCGRGPVEFNFAIDQKDRDQVASLLGGIDRYAVVLPGTNWPTKRWPAERFGELAQPFREKFDLKAVIAGGPDAIPLSSAIPADLNLAGKTTLRQLVALLDRADLVIANDSGPMHIAAALGKPLVTVFGPTNPIRTGPYNRLDAVVRVDIPCSPCYSRNCSHISCMKWVGTDDVVRAAEGQLTGSDSK